MSLSPVSFSPHGGPETLGTTCHGLTPYSPGEESKSLPITRAYVLEGGDIPFSEPIPVVEGMAGAGAGVNPTQAPMGEKGE